LRLEQLKIFKRVNPAESLDELKLLLAKVKKAAKESGLVTEEVGA